VGPSGQSHWGLERNPHAASGAPSQPATLPGAAEKQFEPAWQLGLLPHLDACATRGVTDHPAINRRVFWTKNQFGQLGISAAGPHTCEPSGIHHPLLWRLPWKDLQIILKVRLNFMVSETDTPLPLSVWT